MSTSREKAAESCGWSACCRTGRRARWPPRWGCPRASAPWAKDGKTPSPTRSPSDGSKIYWTASSNGPGPLYVRIDGETTTQISAAAGTLLGRLIRRLAGALLGRGRTVRIRAGRQHENPDRRRLAGDRRSQQGPLADLLRLGRSAGRRRRSGQSEPLPARGGDDEAGGDAGGDGRGWRRLPRAAVGGGAGADEARGTGERGRGRTSSSSPRPR